MASHRAVALFAGALVIRLAALAWESARGRFPEFWEYEHLARNLLAGRGFVYSNFGIDYQAYVEPLYPFLVAGVYAATGGSTLALGVVQCAMSALVAPAIHALAADSFGARAGLVAGVLVAVDPALAGYATRLHPLVLDGLAIALVALTGARLAETATRRRAVAHGLALGFCVLTRPTILAFPALVLAWLAWRRAEPAVWRRWLLALGLAALIVGPWVVRNYAVLGAFVLTRTNTPFVFWLGNHPGSPGGAVDDRDPTGRISAIVRDPALVARLNAERDELAQNRIFRDEALAHVAADPAAFVARFLRKLYYFWWFAPYQGRSYPAWQVLVYRVFYTAALAMVVFALALMARGRLRPAGHGIRTALLVMGALSAAQALFYVDGRHRLAVEPLLLALAGAGLSALTISRARRARDHPRM